MARWRVGVDSGGTFTDICLFEEDEGRVEIGSASACPAKVGTGFAKKDMLKQSDRAG
jgi:N-methylhydantoinase A